MVERIGAFRQASASLQRAKGFFSWQQGNEHGTFDDEDEMPDDNTFKPGAFPNDGRKTSETPWDQAAAVREKLKEELRRESLDAPPSPSRKTRSQATLLPGSNVTDRSERRRQRGFRRGRTASADRLLADDTDAFKQFSGFASCASASHGSTGFKSAPATPIATPASPWTSMNQAHSLTSPTVPIATPMGTPGAADGDGLAWFSTPNTPVPNFASPAIGPAWPVETDGCKDVHSSAPGMFDAAIYAALAALPSSSLVQILRQLQKQRPADFALAQVGSVNASGPDRPLPPVATQPPKEIPATVSNEEPCPRISIGSQQREGRLSDVTVSRPHEGMQTSSPKLEVAWAVASPIGSPTLQALTAIHTPSPKSESATFQALPNQPSPGKCEMKQQMSPWSSNAMSPQASTMVAESTSPGVEMPSPSEGWPSPQTGHGGHVAAAVAEAVAAVAPATPSPWPESTAWSGDGRWPSQTGNQIKRDGWP